MNSELRRWLAFGAGVGIEIGPRDLRVVVVRVRPTGIDLTGAMTIERYAERPAAEWGAAYAGFLKSAGASHLAATVLLPRREVIVRQLALPGVARQDIPSAISYQIDSLHPYAEQEAVHAWAPVGDGGAVLIGITSRATVDRFAALFSEAGIKVAAFTFSAAALYSALRMLGTPAASGFLALHGDPESGELEAYGESPSHPAFSAALDVPTPAFAERARAFALAELRLPPDTETVAVSEVVPQPKSVPEEYDFAPAALPYAAAITAACPRLSLDANLLPPDMRTYNSRAMYVPTIVLGVLVLLGAGGLWGYSRYQEQQYRAALQDEIRTLEPQARKALAMDQEIDTARRRTLMLEDFRKRTRADLEALNELTTVLEPPTWTSNVELLRDTVRFGGEAEQATGLLKTVDQSPLFDGSEFTMPIARQGALEAFAMRAHRQGVVR